MVITQSISVGRVFKAEKGNKCQQASSWLPGGRLVQKEGAEWATSDGAKLSQGGEREQEADFISLLIKKTRQLPKRLFLALIDSAFRPGSWHPRSWLGGYRGWSLGKMRQESSLVR